MSVVCLLPARNCAGDLPGFFESVPAAVDAVVALDDGSTDGTRELLETEPLVRLLLTNPRREDYRGWDDAANRNRLLRAARELEPRWILFLDADERIAEDDRDAFADLVAVETEPPSAYLFRLFEMATDGLSYGPGPWIGRLFAYAPDQVLPTERLHSVPIPTAIRRDRWQKTTIRIQHLAASTAERRIARHRKYLQADPEREYQLPYDYVSNPEGPARTWVRRPPQLPAVPNGTYVPRGPHTGPLLSAVVISRDDGPLIEPTVASVVSQECSFPFEVIVATSGSGGAADIVRRRFPQARVVELDHPALPGEARNAALRVARGRYVACPDSHLVVEPGAFQSLVRAHVRGWAMVTGTVYNGTRTPAGWASYFLDNAGLLPGRPPGPLRLPPVRCSYLREALLEIGGFPEDMRAGEDTVVNQRLFVLGYGAYREPEFVVRHHSRCRTAGTLIKHHFHRGRGLGRILLDDPFLEEALRPMIGFLIRYPVTRVREVRRSVGRWGPELKWRVRIVLPLVWAGALSAWAGVWYELFRAVARPVRRWSSRSAASAPVRS